MEWFDLINETLFALYSILNKIFKNTKETFSESTFKTGLVSFSLYVMFSIVILIYGIVSLKAMNLAEIDILTTNRYLQLETIAFIIGIISNFVNVVFAVVGKDKMFISFWQLEQLYH